MNEREQREQSSQRTTTADLAGMTVDRPGVTAGEGNGQAIAAGAPGAVPVRPAAPGDQGGAVSESAADVNRANGGNGHAAATASPSATGSEEASRTPLLQKSEAEALHTRWVDVQTRFVDDPRRAVQDADALVAELMQRLAKTFADERNSLEQEWSRGGEVSTENLRMALRRYRSFFERLLSV